LTEELAASVGQAAAARVSESSTACSISIAAPAPKARDICRLTAIFQMSAVSRDELSRYAALGCYRNTVAVAYRLVHIADALRERDPGARTKLSLMADGFGGGTRIATTDIRRHSARAAS
jgi:hypothetical protein